MTSIKRRTLLNGFLLVASIGVGVSVPVIAKAIGDPALIPLATRIVIAAIAAASLNLLVGFGGLVSLGHAAFFGLGGYTVAILHSNAISGERFWGFLPGTQQLLVTAPLAMLIGGSAAAVIGAMAMRTRGVQFIMITLAFAQMIFFIVLSLKAYGGEDGLSIRQRNNLGSFSLSDDTIMYFVSLSIMIACFAAMGRLKNSHFGRVLDGIRQNERRMIALGVETFSYKVAAFTIAGMGAGLSGALFANLMRFVSPDMLHWTKSGELLIMVILGGVGNLFGPLAGAIAFICLETLFSSLTEYWQPLVGAVILFIVLMPGNGLVGLVGGRGRGA